MAIKLHWSFAVHPGRWLRDEIVAPAGLSVTALGERLHVTRQAVSTLLNGSAGLSAEMAIRFEKAFGVKADDVDGSRSRHLSAKMGSGARKFCHSSRSCRPAW